MKLLTLKAKMSIIVVCVFLFLVFFLQDCEDLVLMSNDSDANVMLKMIICCVSHVS